MQKFDFLVIGGGIAGLSYAIEVADKGSVAVLFKKGLEESSTAWAQGGIAAVSTPDDDFKLHSDDTITAGAGLCDKKIVEMVISEAPERIEKLIDFGVNFDKDKKSKEFHLNQEGGHSKRRIFHAADHTGYEIQKSLISKVKSNRNISLFTNYSAIDLITSHKLGINLAHNNTALGAYVYTSNGKIESFLADKILMATGGAGKVYLYTSNPDVASGDGIAMCFRAGAPVANMEFFQFHPTCLYHPKAKSFLLTEALRGEGAKLMRTNGELFMEKYHPDAELAPRDIVARAIDHEMKIHGEDYVLLDISHKKANFIREHFPMIYEKCKEYGFDITKEPVPVVPAAHYCCGGVVSDENGCTNIENLYVAGECAHTGLHGANRLASNSLLEGVVFAHRAAVHSLNNLAKHKISFTVPDWDSGSAVDTDEQVIIAQNWDEIRRTMFNYVGIVRSDKRLERALRRSQLIEKEIHEYYWNFKVSSDLLELRNLSLVANLIIRSALQRKESRGLHYNINHPMTRKNFEHDTVIYPDSVNTKQIG
jgi:L-aspartate oxidase